MIYFEIKLGFICDCLSLKHRNAFQICILVGSAAEAPGDAGVEGDPVLHPAEASNRPDLFSVAMTRQAGGGGDPESIPTRSPMSPSAVPAVSPQTACDVVSIQSENKTRGPLGHWACFCHLLSYFFRTRSPYWKKTRSANILRCWLLLQRRWSLQ